jgi:hypothetical protein
MGRVMQNQRRFRQYVQHQAFQVVAGLPQDPETALEIVEAARALLLTSIEAQKPPLAPDLKIVS